MFRKDRRTSRQGRQGTVTVLVVFFLVLLLVMASMTVDIGYLVLAKGELQRSADSAAMAACWEYAIQAQQNGDTQATRCQASNHANQVAQDNPVCGAGPSVPTSDVQWGYLADFTDRNEAINTGAPLAMTNVVSVKVSRTASQNGRVPTYFARILGLPGFETTTTATAGIVRNIKGLTIPADGSNQGFLPLAMDEPTWDNMLSGGGTDDWSFDPTTKTISGGADGAREINLYPHGTGAPGNRGTVDVGSSNNSTRDIARQILHGASPSDLNFHGGSLQFDSSGELILNGDTGISAGIKDELAAIRGEPRVIPIYREVHGPGNNANYTIVRLVGVRIMYVKLTGKKSGKQVIIQPAPVVLNGVIPSTEYTQQSNYVYSPVTLVR